MNSFFKILSIILTVLLIIAAGLYFYDAITDWLYQPTDNMSVIAVVTIVAAFVLAIIMNKLNNLYEVILHLNFGEEEGEEEEEEEEEDEEY